MCAATKFRNAGQVCVSPTRFLIDRSSYDRFVAEFAERTGKLKVGRSWARTKASTWARSPTTVGLRR